MSIFSKIFKKIKHAVEGAIKAIEGVVKNIVKDIANQVKNLAGMVNAIAHGNFSKALEQLEKAAKNGIKTFVDVGTAGADVALNTLGNLHVNKAFSSMVKTLKGLENGIKTGVEKTFTDIVDQAGAIVEDSVKSVGYLAQGKIGKAISEGFGAVQNAAFLANSLNPEMLAAQTAANVVSETCNIGNGVFNGALTTLLTGKPSMALLRKAGSELAKDAATYEVMNSNVAGGVFNTAALDAIAAGGKPSKALAKQMATDVSHDTAVYATQNTNIAGGVFDNAIVTMASGTPSKDRLMTAAHETAASGVEQADIAGGTYNQALLTLANGKPSASTLKMAGQDAAAAAITQSGVGGEYNSSLATMAYMGPKTAAREAASTTVMNSDVAGGVFDQAALTMINGSPSKATGTQAYKDVVTSSLTRADIAGGSFDNTLTNLMTTKPTASNLTQTAKTAAIEGTNYFSPAGGMFNQAVTDLMTNKLSKSSLSQAGQDVATHELTEAQPTVMGGNMTSSLTTLATQKPSKDSLSQAARAAVESVALSNI